ncbi:MAG: hypothetical protein ABL999_18185 [Pyrinomonadaceae bacterium]
MKNNQTTLIIALLLVAGSVVGCSIFGGSNANVANNSTPANANANANVASAAKNDDLPILAAPKLVEMVMTDKEGLNARLKDKEIIVLGEFKLVSNGEVVLTGGALRDIYCSPAPSTDTSAGWPENYKKLDGLAPGAKKPIVEIRGFFTRGTFETIDGLRYVSIYLEKCAVVSIQ